MIIKGTLGRLTWVYSVDGIEGEIEVGQSLTLQILRADGTKVFTTPVTPSWDTTNQRYYYDVAAIDNDRSEPRKAVWTVYDTDGTTILSTGVAKFDILVSTNVYCTTAGMLSKMPGLDLHSSVNADTYVQDAADDMNNALKDRYIVPIYSGIRSDQKLLQRINERLAAGQALKAMAAATNSEETSAYAKELITEAVSGASEGASVIPGLGSLVTGDFVLEGAELISTVDTAANRAMLHSAPLLEDSNGSTTDASPFSLLYNRFQ